ncbi:MAG: glycosyltransferase [Lachnospiraceae bacterium]|nr:glycosyltransferase [Lachnospiraceae bacterium]
MTITTLSNYINHHQIPLSNALYRELGVGYHFIQTEPMEEERVKMGWGAGLASCPYLVPYYEQPEYARKLIMESDIVIFGGVDDESYIEERLQAGKIVIRSSERLYKEGQWKAISPRGLMKKYHDHTRYRKKPVYLLCDGGYVASDFHIVRAYPDKMFTWGYFPKVENYDLEQLFVDKNHEIPEILWTGRFVDFKRPWEIPQLAARLKADGIRAHITFIGGGPDAEKVLSEITEQHLEDMITHLDFQPPQVIRDYMKRSNIYLFNSDYGEGWGAVANEAMNSACALVANQAAGATPTICMDEENALIYQNGDFEEFYQCVVRLIRDKELRQHLGRNAYQAMQTTWNADHAAACLLKQCQRMIQGHPITFEDYGPMSKAKIIPPGKMYRYLKKQACSGQT